MDEILVSFCEKLSFLEIWMTAVSSAKLLHSHNKSLYSVEKFELVSSLVFSVASPFLLLTFPSFFVTHLIRSYTFCTSVGSLWFWSSSLSQVFFRFIFLWCYFSLEHFDILIFADWLCEIHSLCVFNCKTCFGVFLYLLIRW